MNEDSRTALESTVLGGGYGGKGRVSVGFVTLCFTEIILNGSPYLLIIHRVEKTFSAPASTFQAEAEHGQSGLRR